MKGFLESGGAAQLAVFLVTLWALAVPLGGLVARLLEPARGATAPWASRLFSPLENLMLRGAGASARTGAPMTWRHYATALVVFNSAGVVVVYLVQRLQGLLPLNPLGLGAVEPGVAMNVAISFVTNTNWQAYGGETTMSFLTQMVALTTQNFVSAATGIAVVLAVARAFLRHGGPDAGPGHVGNFWVDLVRITVRVLLPLSLVLALALVATGVPQTLQNNVTATLVDASAAAADKPATQTLALGPVASQVAIKQLGTNGGGFYNANSAHPFENPTPWSNALTLLAILVLPAALCFAWGHWVRDRRQGLALCAAMTLLFVPAAVFTMAAEQQGNAALSTTVDQTSTPLSSGGNLEGKEVRFGALASALWATATTAASNGSVNAMHDSFTALGGLVPMLLMQLGEVVFGGVGSGLYGMLLFVIVAVFLAGLMVGRTPELLGKKLEVAEMKMAILGILLPSMLVLTVTAVACLTPLGYGTIANPGPHGFSEILYAASSAANNNGSAFAGITVNTPFWTTALSAAMWLSRFGVIVAVLAIAGSVGAKKTVPPSTATLPTHTPLFVVLLAGTVVLVGALTFVPALALGPIVEHLQSLRESL